jgi:hypothetical protein
MSEISVPIGNLQPGIQYTVTYGIPGQANQTVTGTLHSLGQNIVIKTQTGMINSFPVEWFRSAHVYVIPELPGDLNRHINSFGSAGGTRRRNRKNRRNRRKSRRNRK